MPFIALNKLTKKRIDITLLDKPREVLKADELACQICGQDLIIKAGMIVRAHFAHKPQQLCSSEYKAHPESAAHREAKRFLKEELPNHFTDYKGVRLEYEVPIKPVKRIADVLAIFPNGHRVAHEVQLAKITITELEVRTQDYARAGIDVVWWLGLSANTESNQEWCLQTFGECFMLNIKS